MNAREEPQQLQQAIALHRTGQLAAARMLYEAILRHEPGHFDALHLLGVIAAQTGDTERAARLIGQALAVDPNNAAAYVNHGLALKELGRLDAALMSFRRAMAHDPRLPEPCYQANLSPEHLS